MTAQTYFSPKLNCFISINTNNEVTFIFDNDKIPMIGKHFAENDIQLIETDFTANEMLIEGVLVQFRNHVSFTGRFDEFGYVAEDFKMVS